METMKIGLLYFIAIFSLNLSAQNIIDGVTGASPNMNTEVDSGFCYDTFAVLYIRHHDSFDKHFMMYGLDTTMFSDSLIVPNWPYSQICTLSNLTPSTSYYFRYRGELISNTAEEQYTKVGIMETQSVFQDTRNPSITLLSPSSGDSIIAGINTVIKWESSDNVGVVRVDILQSSDEGSGWDTIGNVINSTDSLEFSFEFRYNTETKLKVIAYDEAGLSSSDSTAEPFYVYAITPIKNSLNTFSINKRSISLNNSSLQFSYPLNSGDQIKLLNLKGEVVRSFSVSEKTLNNIFLNDLTNGVYLVNHVRNGVSLFKAKISYTVN